MAAKLEFMIENISLLNSQTDVRKELVGFFFFDRGTESMFSTTPKNTTNAVLRLPEK